MARLDIETFPSGVASSIREICNTYRERICLDCCRFFIDKASLRRHDTMKHFWCTDCKRSFGSRGEAQSHRTQAHNGY